ncbi:MAG: beta-lactamase family protein, partial [Caldilineaceae bacterium]|nr:beta-lactamase family protein [Caldilineaceae bacterium]
MNQQRFWVYLLCLAAAVGGLLTFTPATSAQTGAEGWRRAVDAYIAAQMEQLGIPGVAVGVVREDRIAYLQGYGVADDDGRPVTPQTPFHIASLSKGITAAAVMQLVDAGKLELDAPVQRYLPWFRLTDADAAAQLTVRHLLVQTSGFSEMEGYVRNLDANMDDNALEQSFRARGALSLHAPPGAQYEYSNTQCHLVKCGVSTPRCGCSPVDP